MSSDVEIETTSTPGPRARILAAAQAFSAAITEHAAAVVAASGDTAALVAADEALTEVLTELDDAYAALTGEVHPMRDDSMYAPAGGGCGGNCACAGGGSDSDEADEALDAGVTPMEAGTVISIVQRHDYTVSAPDALIAAGREAYLKNSPTATAEDAERDVTDVDLALLHLAHTDGWADLWQLEGLDALGGVSAVVEQPEPLDGDSEEWPEYALGGVLDEDADPLFVQVDVYGD